MQRFFAKLESARDVHFVLELTWRVLRRYGASGFSYHQVPAFTSPISRSVLIFARGYAVENQRAYVAEGFRQRDPFPAITFEHGPVIDWKSAMMLGDSIPGARAYFAEMQRRGIVHGLSLALYGPFNRDAYTTIAYNAPPDEFQPGQLLMLHSLLQTIHGRICKILDDCQDRVALSDREVEVLRWISMGKSNTDIATILSISPETVRTYTRRVYGKLGVGDRVAATVRALKMGLIEG